MPKLVLDSDLLSDLLRDGNQNVTRDARLYMSQNSVLTFTSWSTMEILSGLEHIQAHTQLRRAEALFASNDEILPESEDYRLTAEIIGALLRMGKPIGFIDPAIAACAIRRGYGVATANTRHFTFIQQAGYSFQLENWRDV